jgi:predicted AlkP superfamily pyrophosphatase or phosphodiesterase
MNGRPIAVMLGLVLLAQQPVPAESALDRHVVVICVDGLPAYLFDDPNAAMPNIKGLAAKGVIAQGMTVSNPAVTWPNHTSMMTGVRPAMHGVLFNGMLERTGLGLPVKVDGRKDKSELVRVPTLYDLLHSSQFTTAAINWPCTRNSKTLDDDFPDVPDSLTHTTPRFVESMKRNEILSDASIQGFAKLGPIARDRIWTQAVCQVITERKPNFVLFHLLNVDATHHKYGPQSWAGYSAVAYADSCVRDVLDALQAAGIRERTTIFVVSDHGFMSIPNTLQPNVLLRKAGLLTVEGTTVTTARAQVVPEGGIGMLYLTVPDKIEEDRKRVIALFREHPEVEAIVMPEEFTKYGLPQPREYPQMADLILVAKDGYSMNAVATGDDFVIKNEGTPGTHGFLSTNPKMNATFVASGAGIVQGKKMGMVEYIDIAPTIAQLFGVSLKHVEGRVLTEALQGGEGKTK